MKLAHSLGYHMGDRAASEVTGYGHTPQQRWERCRFADSVPERWGTAGPCVDLGIDSYLNEAAPWLSLTNVTRGIVTRGILARAGPCSLAGVGPWHTSC